MGAVRVEMFLNEIECEDMAEERLSAFMALIDQYPIEVCIQDDDGDDGDAAEDTTHSDPATGFAALVEA